ncbi:hypothetical protein DJ524_00415 [Sulfolobus sp. D5]|nr:hypothetical protein DJ524_00415 [Sulfolobus sp. D5]
MPERDPESLLLEYFKKSGAERGFFILKGLNDFVKNFSEYREFINDQEKLFNVITEYQLMLSIAKQLTTRRGGLRTLERVLSDRFDIRALEKTSQSLAADLERKLSEECSTIVGYYNQSKFPIVLNKDCTQLYTDPYNNADYNFPSRLLSFAYYVAKIRYSYNAVNKVSRDFFQYYAEKVNYNNRFGDIGDAIRTVNEVLLNPGSIQSLRDSARILRDVARFLCDMCIYLGFFPVEVNANRDSVEHLSKLEQYLWDSTRKILYYIKDHTSDFLNLIPQNTFNAISYTDFRSALTTTVNTLINVLQNKDIKKLESILTNGGQLSLLQAYMADLLFFIFFSIVDALDLYNNDTKLVKDLILKIPYEDRLRISSSILGIGTGSQRIKSLSCWEIYDRTQILNDISRQVYTNETTVTGAISSLYNYVLLSMETKYTTEDIVKMFKKILSSKAMMIYLAGYPEYSDTVKLLDRLENIRDYTTLINDLVNLNDVINKLRDDKIIDRLSTMLIKVVKGEPPNPEKLDYTTISSKVVRKREVNISMIKNSEQYDFESDTRVVRTLPPIYQMWSVIKDGDSVVDVVNNVKKSFGISDDNLAIRMTMFYLNTLASVDLIWFEEKAPEKTKNQQKMKTEKPQGANQGEYNNTSPITGTQPIPKPEKTPKNDLSKPTTAGGLGIFLTLIGSILWISISLHLLIFGLGIFIIGLVLFSLTFSNRPDYSIIGEGIVIFYAALFIVTSIAFGPPTYVINIIKVIYLINLILGIYIYVYERKPITQ